MRVGPMIDVDAWNPAHGVCNQRKLVQEACVALLPVEKSLPLLIICPASFGCHRRQQIDDKTSEQGIMRDVDRNAWTVLHPSQTRWSDHP